jgi:hypothetical protein
MVDLRFAALPDSHAIARTKSPICYGEFGDDHDVAAPRRVTASLSTTVCCALIWAFFGGAEPQTSSV